MTIRSDPMPCDCAVYVHVAIAVHHTNSPRGTGGFAVNEIGVDGATSLAEALKENTALTTLYLGVRRHASTHSDPAY